MPAVPATQSVIQGRIGRLEVIPFRAAMGTEVKGLDLKRLDDESFGVLYQAYLDHLLVLVRGQQLSDPDLMALACRFGAIELPPVGQGANTEFCNTYAAYDALPDDLKQRVHGMTIKHDTAYDTNQNLRRGAQAVADVRVSPGPSHPMVYTHPETGCNALFLGRRPKHYVDGLSLEESEALLDALWTHMVQPRFGIVHEWQSGDVVLWDNRCTLHRRGAFNPGVRRVMHAAQVRGQKPAEAPDARARLPHPRARLFAMRNPG